VLLRMKLGHGDVIPPLSFLPIAEEFGLLDDIDRWVIARSIQTLAEQHKAGRNIALMVKITPSGLTESNNLGLLVTELVKRSGIPGERLIFEIPEAKAFTNLKPVQDFTNAVAKVGASLCLAQFGSGLNSFQLLKHINAGYLKIDRSFMQDLSKNAETQKKVREIAAESQKLGKQTIVEFVSDAASLTTLFSSGVDYVEGHFLSPAGPELNYDFSAF
jgi:EAL domain-containing protein (putative c-di-GMP-specific phosphodiesterase class I)